MATDPNPLSVFGELVDRLSPLADKRRGMRIEADEWNGLVAVVQRLLEFEYTQEKTLTAEFEQAFAPSAHAHPGEIGISSLDPELQARLGGDGGGVGTRVALADMQATLDALTAQVGRLTRISDELQTRVDRSAGDTLERFGKLRDFEQRFVGIENLRGVVSGLSAEVGALRPATDAVLELRDSLQGVDVSALQTRLADVEALRENLQAADGSLLRMRDVELKLTELESGLDAGGGGDLDARFAALDETVAARLETRLDTRLTEVGAANAAAIADARTGLEAGFDTRFQATRAELDDRAASDRTALEGTLNTLVGDAAAELRGSLTTATETQLDSRLANLPIQIADAAQTALAAATPALREQLDASLRADLDARLVAAETLIATRADGLDARFAERDAAISGQIADRTAEQLPGLIEARFAQASDQLGAQLGARVGEQLAQARDGLSVTLGEQVAASVATALGDLDGSISAQLEPRLAGLDADIATAVAERLADIDQRVAGEVRAQIDGLALDGRLAQMSDQLVAQWRAELATSETRIREDIGNERLLDRSAVSNEIAQARDDAVNVTLDRMSELETQQEQLAARIDESKQEVVGSFDVLLRNRLSGVDSRMAVIEANQRLLKPIVPIPGPG